MVEMTTLPSRISSAMPRISAMVVGEARDRLHHGHQAAFDALGDFDFAFAGQQFHRAHFAHVHAHGVGGAAEFGVHGGQRGFGCFFGFFFGGAGLALLSEISSVSASGACSYTATPMSFKMEMMASRVSASTSLSGKWSLISCVGEVAAGLAQLDQRLSGADGACSLLLRSGRCRPGRIPSSRRVPWPC